MSNQIQQQESRLKELIAKGKEQGYITYAEVNDHLPDDISDPDQIEDIIRMINDMGITVYETAPDSDELLTTGENTADEIAAEEAAAALAAVETEAGRTTDPVRMYMREMGTVELLTREGEIAIAKRIEEGIRDTLSALAYYPGAVEYLLETYAEVTKEVLTEQLGVEIGHQVSRNGFFGNVRCGCAFVILFRKSEVHPVERQDFIGNTHGVKCSPGITGPTDFISVFIKNRNGVAISL